MQETSDFQKIISQWRRLSGEQIESSVLISMSGDSHHPTVKKEEDSERDSLVPDSSKLPLAVAGASATASIVEPAPITIQQEEKQDMIEPELDKEEHKKQAVHSTKDASGDSQKNENKSNSGNLEPNESSDVKEKNKEDNVDSVYLRPPPPHKARSNNSTPPVEEEDCGIKCLYYTLQCCDCVLM